MTRSSVGFAVNKVHEVFTYELEPSLWKWWTDLPCTYQEHALVGHALVEGVLQDKSCFELESCMFLFHSPADIDQRARLAFVSNTAALHN